ncbi:MAG: hypothetical protein HY711_09155, partial [Candidatus Melainabacteria bacterium]|nr:hypothetical protein [Candidatus Melainabacteria bacterium]
VIGVHCGRLPQSPGRGSAITSLNQLIWVDALYQCLDLSADTKSVEELSQPQESVSVGGCTELARVDCPRCGSSSLASAKFCKSCGQRLWLDVKLGVGMKLKPLATLGAVLAVVMVCVLFLYLSFGRTIKPPAVGKVSPSMILEATVDKADLEKAAWVTMPKGSIFHSGDVIRIRIKVLGDFVVYALHQGTTSQDVHLIYPDSPSEDKQCSWGSVLTIPRETVSSPAKGKVALQGLTIYGNPGRETVVLLASSTKSTLMTQPGQLTDVFLQATQILNSTPSETGLEVSQSAFGKSVFPHKSGNQDKSVYLARFQIIHGE